MRTRDDLKPWLRKMPKWVIFSVTAFLGLIAIPVACWVTVRDELWPEFVDIWDDVKGLDRD